MFSIADPREKAVVLVPYGQLPEASGNGGIFGVVVGAGKMAQ